MIAWKLYLDDCADDTRKPEISVESRSWRINRGLSPFPPDTSSLGNWKIARSYDEAVALMDEFGLPEFVSFDHDLCDETPGKDGFGVAKEIVSRDMRSRSLSKTFFFEVHSWNPIGAKNISSYLESYLASRDSIASPDDYSIMDNILTGMNDEEAYAALFGSNDPSHG